MPASFLTLSGTTASNLESVVEQAFIDAGRNLVLCELTDREGNVRLVEPYMIFNSTRGKRQFHCFQLEGHSKSSTHYSWKNLDVSEVVSVTPTKTRFHPRSDYNPENRRNFPVVHFAIPKVGGAAG